jgi:hypothetical protein
MRMKEKKGKIESANESFLELLDYKGAAARSDYSATIQNLYEVFDESEVLISFYEELFNDDQLRRICDFAGLPFRPGKYEVRVNSGEKASQVPLSDEQRREARKKLASVYDFCRDFFGDRLPARWKL